MGAACTTGREVRLPMRKPTAHYDLGDGDTPDLKQKGRDRFPTPMPAELMRVWTRRGVFDTETPEMFGSEYTTSGPHPVDGSIHPRLGPNTRKYRRNTVTPTRMSVAHPIDGSVHPLPLTQMKRRHYSINNPNIQWPSDEIIQRSVRRSNQRLTKDALPGGDSVKVTKLASNASIASLTSEIEHGADGTELDTQPQKVIIVRARQLPPISSPPQLSEPDMGSRQARYIVGTEEVAQRAGPVLDYEELFSILMSHQQELFGVDAEDEFEDKCAKLDDGIVPVRLQNTPYQPQSYEEEMIQEIGGDMEKTAKEFGKTYRRSQRNGRSSGTPRGKTSRQNKKATSPRDSPQLKEAESYPTALNPFLIDAKDPNSAGEMCSVEYEAVPENYASAFVLNWYQSAALKHSLPTKEAYVTVTRSAYNLTLDDGKPKDGCCGAEKFPAEPGPSRQGQQGRNTVTSSSSRQSGAGDMPTDIVGRSMTPVDSTSGYSKHTKSKRAGAMVIEVVAEETLSDSEGQRASAGTAHITVQSAKPAIEAAAPTSPVAEIPQGKSTATPNATPRDINMMKGVMGACVDRLEAETNAQTSPNKVARVETTVTDKKVSIKCACEMETTETVQRIITGGDNTNMALLQTSNNAQTGVQPDVSGPRIQVLDDSDEEIMGTGANPFVEAQIWKESRDSAPAHLKDPVDNVHHEAVPRAELRSLVAPKNKGTHTYYEEPLTGQDDGKVLNVGTESVLPDKDRVSCIGVTKETMVSSMPPEKEGNDNNVVGVSALKRDLSPVPTADKETVPENKQTSCGLAPLRPTRRLPPLEQKKNKNKVSGKSAADKQLDSTLAQSDENNITYYGSAATEGQFFVMPK